MKPTACKILVTGGAGFIGSNFIHYLLQHHPDWQIVNLDKLTYAGNLENLAELNDDPRYTFVHGDIADRNLVKSLFEEQKFDMVAHLAAESHVDRSILDASPFIETNIKGTQVLLEAAKEYGLKKFLQVSTDEVYGSLKPDEPPFTEESALQPNSPYSASKAAADLLARAYFVTFGVPVVITRSSNNYGPYQFPEKLIPLMIKNALEGKSLPIYGKGENIRDWIFVEDNCCALDLALQKGRVGEIYNIGGGWEKKNIEVVGLICDILAEELGKSIEEFKKLIAFVKDRPGHDLRYALDSSKIKEELDWQPKISFDDGLRRTVEWYLSHQDWVEKVISGEYVKYYEKIYGSKA